MDITNLQVIALVGSEAFRSPGALRELHGLMKPVRNAKDEAVTDANGHAALELHPYEFTPGTRSKLALLFTKLSPHASAFEEERKDIVRTFRTKALKAKTKDNTGLLDETSPVWDDFNAAVNKLLLTKVKIERTPKIAMADLKPDENNLSPTALAAVVPVLEPTPE